MGAHVVRFLVILLIDRLHRTVDCASRCTYSMSTPNISKLAIFYDTIFVDVSGSHEHANLLIVEECRNS